MHITIYPLQFILKLPPGHVSIQRFRRLLHLFLKISDCQRKRPSIRVSNGDIGGVSHQVLVYI